MAAQRPPFVFCPKVTQHLADRCRAVATGCHRVLHEPLSGVWVKNGIAQMALKHRELQPTSRRLSSIRTTLEWALPS
jgi:hypothetical protein